MRPLKRVVIKEELVELTGDYRPAIILNQFLYWTARMYDTDKYIREEKARAEKCDMEVDIDESNGWIYKTSEELNEELMIGISVPTMRKYIKQLVEAGFILERKNPKYKWDKTMQYRVDLYKVQLELGKKGYSLEGYKILPGINIVSDINTGETEVSIINKKAEVDPPTPTKDIETNKNVYENSIAENNQIKQVENVSEEDIIREMAINNLRELYSNFDQQSEGWKRINVINEMFKIKERQRSSNWTWE